MASLISSITYAVLLHPILAAPVDTAALLLDAGTSTPLYRCSLTLILCVWSLSYMALPHPEKSLTCLWMRLLCYFDALFRPGIIVSQALMEWAAMRRLRNNLETILITNHEAAIKSLHDLDRSKPLKDPLQTRKSITTLYAWYVVMGGFEFNKHDLDQFAETDERATLCGAGVLFLARNERLPSMLDSSIGTKSKMYFGINGLLLINALWLVCKAIGGVGTRALTVLEIYTFVHVLCTFVVYIFWLQKPPSIQRTLVEISGFEHLIALLIFRSERFPRYDAERKIVSESDVMAWYGDMASVEGPEMDEDGATMLIGQPLIGKLGILITPGFESCANKQNLKKFRYVSEYIEENEAISGLLAGTTRCNDLQCLKSIPRTGIYIYKSGTSECRRAEVKIQLGDIRPLTKLTALLVVPIIVGFAYLQAALLEFPTRIETANWIWACCVLIFYNIGLLIFIKVVQYLRLLTAWLNAQPVQRPLFKCIRVIKNLVAFIFAWYSLGLFLWYPESVLYISVEPFLALRQSLSEGGSAALGHTMTWYSTHPGLITQTVGTLIGTAAGYITACVLPAEQIGTLILWTVNVSRLFFRGSAQTHLVSEGLNEG